MPAELATGDQSGGPGRHEAPPGPEAASGVDVEGLVADLVESSGAIANRDLLREIIATALELANVDASRLDLKIASSALGEMARAFELFAPFRGRRKLTMFGSARTADSDPLYALASELAGSVARQGWMVVTGAGPGIMAAGTEGAGADMALGVEIRLPFETASHPQLVAEGRLVEMKYFFTRKLMLLKESAAFAVLPGGFGTLDECFELLTLLQTGKAEPAPIVMLDLPGDPYWRDLDAFIRNQVLGRHLADEDDVALYTITDSVEAASSELLGFYRNYHSRRFVGSTMVIRCRAAPSDEQIADLSERYRSICSDRGIWRTGPLSPERTANDHLDMPRIALEFDRRSHGKLRRLIDDLNTLDGPDTLDGPESLDGPEQ